MVCPNCGAQNEAGAKFCADCGNRFSEPAPVAASPIAPATPMPATQALPPAPPPWAQPAQPAQPVPAPQAPPPWSQSVAPTGAAPTPSPWVPQQPPQPPQPQQPAYGQQAYAPQAYAPAPAYPSQGYGTPPAATAAGAKVLPIAALLAVAGGAIAIASGWLPWETAFGLSVTPMDKGVTDRTSDLANGYYLVAAGALAVICGLAMFLRLARGAATLVAVGAIVGGCIVLAVEAVAYSDMADSLKYASLGYGLYVGIAGGAVAIAGGAMALRKPR